jgi:hypothetical protein
MQTFLETPFIGLATVAVAVTTLAVLGLAVLLWLHRKID